LERDSWGWETHERRFFVSKLGKSLDTKKDDLLKIKGNGLVHCGVIDYRVEKQLRNI